MRNKSILLFLILALSIHVNGSVQAQMLNLKLISYKIASFNPSTFDVTLIVTIQNDTTDYIITNILGTIYKNNKPFIIGSASELGVQEGVSTISVLCRVNRCKGISFFNLLGSILTFNPQKYTADISVNVKWPTGLIEEKHRKGITINRFTPA